jgi:hypothetical protein
MSVRHTVVCAPAFLRTAWVSISRICPTMLYREAAMSQMSRAHGRGSRGNLLPQSLARQCWPDRATAAAASSFSELHSPSEHALGVTTAPSVDGVTGPCPGIGDARCDGALNLQENRYTSPPADDISPTVVSPSDAVGLPASQELQSVRRANTLMQAVSITFWGFSTRIQQC